ncbi:MAG TPA: EAL domain-containing protein [Acidimicrobiales bacterium]|nr:EAL domain-containing protein [Acidimicrobiales bacterium]
MASGSAARRPRRAPGTSGAAPRGAAALDVLLVEPDDDVARWANGVLHDSTDPDLAFSVRRVTTTAAALAAVAERRPSVVLVDQALVGGSSSDAIESLSAADRTLPLVVLTDSAGVARARRSLLDGAVDYLVTGVATTSQVTRSLRYAVSIAANPAGDPSGEPGARPPTPAGRPVTTAPRPAFQSHDDLTGLPNRASLVEELARLLETPGARDQIALLFFDVDHLEAVNERYGHQTGDELLRKVADILAAAVRPADTLARLAGDEFAIICRGVDDAKAAERLAEKLAEAVSRPLILGIRTLRVTASVGVAISDRSSTSDSLLSEADAALHHAKARGRARVEVFDDALRNKTLMRLRLQQDLRHAVDKRQLRLHYQPIFEIATGQLTGFEALIRWQHPELGLLGPDRFIDLAERTLRMASVGSWVLRNACGQLAEWQRAHPDLSLSMSLNLSAHQLSDPRLPDLIGEILEETGVLPARLCLEMTESVVMEDAPATAQALHALRALGIRLAIDDFGTGYSSLAYLKRFPVDHVKIDRSFVAGLARDPEDTVIVDSIIHLASRLGLEVVAEGVETEAQLAELARLSCRYGQGYLWSRPALASDAGELINQSIGGAFRQQFRLPPNAGATPEALRSVGSTAARQVDDTVSMLAHELRTPVHVIRGFADLMRADLESGSSEALAESIDTIRHQTIRMEALVASLDDARAIDEGTLQLDRQPVELAGLVQRTVTHVAQELRGHTVDCGPLPAVSVLGDQNRIEQILTNLLKNAGKFSPEGAPIKVAQEVRGNEVSLHVIDRGPGVPADRIGGLFRKFSRLGSMRGGNGLGLYLSRGFALAHGGELRYRRADTGGADFVLTLPIHHGVDEVVAGPERPAAAVRTLDPAPSAHGRELAMAAPAIRADADAVGAALAASRALLRARTPEDAVGAAIDLVHDLGGRVVPARIAPEHALPMDLSFGEGEAILPVAELFSVARMRLEHILPGFLEDSRLTVQAVRLGKPRRSSTDPETGLSNRRSLTQSVGTLGRGDAVAILRLRHEAPWDDGEGRAELGAWEDDTIRSLARMVRAELGARVTCGRWRRRELLVALRATSAEEAVGLASGLQEVWADWRAEPVGFSVALMPVGERTGLDAANEASRSLSGPDDDAGGAENGR